jgi:hypothetical protein
MIFAVDVHTKQSVHVQALGFTTYFLTYAEAKDKEQAERKIVLWLKSKQVETSKVFARPAISQIRETYAFPEYIH